MTDKTETRFAKYWSIGQGARLKGRQTLTKAMKSLRVNAPG